MFNFLGGKGKKSAPAGNTPKDQRVLEGLPQGPFKGGFQPKAVALELNFPTELPQHTGTTLVGQNPQAGFMPAPATDAMEFDPNAVSAGMPTTMQPDYLPASDAGFGLSDLPVTDFTDADFSIPLMDNSESPLAPSLNHDGLGSVTDSSTLEQSFNTPFDTAMFDSAIAQPNLTQPVMAPAPLPDVPETDLFSVDTFAMPGGWSAEQTPNPFTETTPGSDDWAQQAAARLDAVGDTLYPPETFDVGIHTETLRVNASPSGINDQSDGVSWDMINDLKTTIPVPESDKFNWSGNESVTFTSSITTPPVTVQNQAVAPQPVLPKPDFSGQVLGDDFTLPDGFDQPQAITPTKMASEQPLTSMPFPATLDDTFTLPVMDPSTPTADGFDFSAISSQNLFVPDGSISDTNPIMTDGVETPNRLAPDALLNTSPTPTFDSTINVGLNDALLGHSGVHIPVINQPVIAPVNSVPPKANEQTDLAMISPVNEMAPVVSAPTEPFTARDVRDTVLLGEHCVHLVQQGQGYYLTTQQGDQWIMLKDLSGFGLKPSTGVQVLLEGYAGGKEVYTVTIGTWKAILNADTQGISLHTELN